MNRASSFISNNLDQVRQHVDQVKYSVVPTLADLGQLVWEDLKFIEDAEDDDGDDVDYKSEIYEDVCISVSRNIFLALLALIKSCCHLILEFTILIRYFRQRLRASAIFKGFIITGF